MIFSFVGFLFSQTNSVKWVKNAPAASDDISFKNLSENYFYVCRHISALSKELNPLASLNEVQTGDVFVAGGFGGHAVLVVDVCENKRTHEKLFIIQQGYMPAQEIQILKNYTNTAFSPWYSINFAGDLKTPQWTFKKSQLMRF